MALKPLKFSDAAVNQALSDEDVMKFNDKVQAFKKAAVDVSFAQASAENVVKATQEWITVGESLLGFLKVFASQASSSGTASSAVDTPKGSG